MALMMACSSNPSKSEGQVQGDGSGGGTDAIVKYLQSLRLDYSLQPYKLSLWEMGNTWRTQWNVPWSLKQSQFNIQNGIQLGSKV